MKNTAFAAIVLLLLGGIGASTPVVAGPARSWSYSELLQAADLVIIGTPIAHGESSAKPADQRERRSPISTTFQILGVLKGSPPKDRDSVTMNHYRYANPLSKAEADARPVAVSFQGEPRDYLVFLKQTADGHFEPVTLAGDHRMSVRILSAYSPPPRKLPTGLKPSAVWKTKAPTKTD